MGLHYQKYSDYYHFDFSWLETAFLHKGNIPCTEDFLTTGTSHQPELPVVWENV